jgi:RNA polymerase sigma-70 factor (ECF subfamily)
MEKDLDMELYNKYLDGDKDAFELLYNKYKNKIQYFIFNIVKDYQKAEDITQEVFIYAMQNKVRDGYTFKYYIFLIAKSRAYNYINMENRRLEINEQYLSKEEEQIENDVANIIEESEKRKELIDAINMLDDKYKNAIYLVNIEELSYKETAEILGESVQNIKNLVHRGKVNLRKILLKKGFNEMNKVSKVLTIIICMIVILSGVTYAGVVIYNKYIKKQEEVNSRGLFDLGDGITTYETDLMANDMTWNENSRLYHKIIDNSEDYQIYKTRINELPNIEEINFDENFVVIIANENIRQMHEKDLTISDIVADDTTTHIIMKQKENPNYDNDNNIWYAIVDKSQLRDNADVEIEQHNISSEEFTKLEDLSYDYSK